MEGGEHVPVGVCLPRWLCCCAEWMAHTLIAPHNKFQMQRTCIGGDTSETDPPRPLLREWLYEKMFVFKKKADGRLNIFDGIFDLQEAPNRESADFVVAVKVSINKKKELAVFF